MVTQPVMSAAEFATSMFDVAEALSHVVVLEGCVFALDPNDFRARYRQAHGDVLICAVETVALCPADYAGLFADLVEMLWCRWGVDG